jgi:putative transcriptional regulator
VLNRPSAVKVEDVVAPLAPLVADGELLFVGGPVQPQSPVILAELAHPELADVLVFGPIGFLTGEVKEKPLDAVRRARVFAGYAGWGPGQLEAEMEEESWIAEQARPDDVFADDPSRLWEDVLRRKGSAFDLLRLMPVDPSAN